MTFSVNSPVSLSNMAMLCCLACRSHPTIFISASFVPSLFGLDNEKVYSGRREAGVLMSSVTSGLLAPYQSSNRGRSPRLFESPPREGLGNSHNSARSAEVGIRFLFSVRSVRTKHGKQLDNDAPRPAAVHSAIRRVFGDRGDSWRPRPGLPGLTSNAEVGSSSARDNQVRANHCRGRFGSRRTPE